MAADAEKMLVCILRNRDLPQLVFHQVTGTGKDETFLIVSHEEGRDWVSLATIDRVVFRAEKPREPKVEADGR